MRKNITDHQDFSKYLTGGDKTLLNLFGRHWMIPVSPFFSVRTSSAYRSTVLLLPFSFLKVHPYSVVSSEYIFTKDMRILVRSLI